MISVNIAFGRELIFISRIKRDGSGVDMITEDMSYWDNTAFYMNSLSLTNETFIACEFNSYVVKLKKPLVKSP